MNMDRLHWSTSLKLGVRTNAHAPLTRNLLGMSARQGRGQPTTTEGRGGERHFPSPTQRPALASLNYLGAPTLETRPPPSAGDGQHFHDLCCCWAVGRRAAVSPPGPPDWDSPPPAVQLPAREALHGTWGASPTPLATLAHGPHYSPEADSAVSF